MSHENKQDIDCNQLLPEKIAYDPIDLSKAVIQPLHDALLSQHGMAADVLRLDQIHPVVSGNKWFKLKYHLQQALATKCKGIVTLGGAWSNHLVATAYACRQSSLSCIGIVRGEAPPALSITLQDATRYGMQLQFVSRKTFASHQELLTALQAEYPDHLIVPQGGQSAYGVQGAADILQLVPLSRYSHILCAAGTGTMLAGLVQASLPHQQVIGISVLKMPETASNSIVEWVTQNTPKKNFSLLLHYHFGGYARSNEALIRLMNEVYNTHQVPTDFVYTGKLFAAFADLVQQQYFPEGSTVLLVHSGGLQGNRSLAPGILTFQ